MARNITEFESILKAIQSSYQLLQDHNQCEEMAVQNLKEAEQSLNNAINYLLSDSRTRGYL